MDNEKRCAWCGETETPNNLIEKYIISPPVDGYSADCMDYHAKCSAEAARAMVE